MSTVVYLANQQIQIVSGMSGKNTISVKQSYTLQAPEGSLINGIIMDPGLFISFMTETWKQYALPAKDVYLVINSTKFLGRSIEMPVMKDKKRADYIAREYAEMGRDEDMIFSYIHIDSLDNKMEKVYAEGIEPEFISEYIDIFAEIGVKLAGIYSGESSLITFTEKTAATQNKTFVLIVADAMTLTTLLWVNGSFYYYNSSRCFQEPGTMEYAADIAKSVSQLSQFMQANQIDYRLENIQIAGVNPNDVDMYQEAMRDRGIDILVRVFQFATGGLLIDPNLQNYLHAVAGLYNGGKGENFILQLNNKKNKKEDVVKDVDTSKALITVGIIFAVMLLITIVLALLTAIQKNELNAIEDYNNSPNVIMQTTEYDMLMGRNEYLTMQHDAITKVEEDLSTYPCGNTTVLQVFELCAFGYANVEYLSFDANEGTIEIKAMAPNVDDINKFIRELSEKDVFNRIDYTGYTFDNETQMWNINVTCTMAEAAGRKEAE